ncbi:MAG: hypothetical protein IPO30_06745 [Hyphomonadaceae bacterium]|nr:hypothetical protein [Hyphomonadaceae bacterium]
MTRRQHTHAGLVTSSPLDRWIDAMLASNVVSTLQMIRRHLPAECHSEVTLAVLPREKSDTVKETIAVAHDSPKALILTSAVTCAARRTRAFSPPWAKSIMEADLRSALLAHAGIQLS